MHHMIRFDATSATLIIVRESNPPSRYTTALRGPSDEGGNNMPVPSSPGCFAAIACHVVGMNEYGRRRSGFDGRAPRTKLRGMDPCLTFSWTLNHLSEPVARSQPEVFLFD